MRTHHFLALLCLWSTSCAWATNTTFYQLGQITGRTSAFSGIDPFVRRQDGACVTLCGAENCCVSGWHCCSDCGSCCPTGYTCAAAAGCCPVGKICKGFQACAGDPTEVLCAGNLGCCPLNSACSVDGCVSLPASCPAATIDPPDFPPSTESNSPPSTSDSPPSSIFSPEPTFDKPTSTFDPGTTPTFAPTPGLPAAVPGTSQTIVRNDDPRIIYSPPSAWEPVQQTSCNGDTTVKRGSGVGSKFSFTFNGTSVALLTSANDQSPIYSVEVLGAGLQVQQTAIVDGFMISTVQCATGFATTGLEDGLHTITVTIQGAGEESESQGMSLDFDALS
ncbi:hypothetical protein EXIGLDRAFT_233072 [Exidia glandulosa HHB12029]|uniref:Uncharacterized protein n=1 Tax=Exidia glandulosa HHB12029 TaxID=1314781 RepID=A0A165E347_EXIGL|nr:hypothetical protein EXIGLDRAFT_233072 [Exidia glandulosa HHB12029]